tara:strand:+ start:6841 stop:7146 length:306 start_codon:yes stop_codon:yes gene_type:complete
MKKIILLIVLSFVFACSSNDDSPNCADVSDEGIAAVEALLTTGIAFAGDQSNSNCLAYKTALENYIAYSQSILDCLEGTDLSELQTEIAELQLELTNLSCS